MAEGTVDLEITQNEDWTTDLIWTDNTDTGMPVVHPCRMTIKAKDGSTLISLVTNPSIPSGTIPQINLSTDIGLIQLHINKTESNSFPPGLYSYDLFVTYNDGTAYAGPQQVALLTGSFTVLKRYTYQ